MKKRQIAPAAVRVTTALVDDQIINEGQRLLVEGEEGVFYFRYLSSADTLTCWGGLQQHESWRSFKAIRCHLPGWHAPKADTASEDKVSRSAKYSAFELWANGHQEEVFSTNDLVDISGFSMPTLLKYLSTSLIFEKVKRGQWRVRNLEGTRTE